MTKVAITQLDDRVAPRFEAARSILIVSLKDNTVTNRQVVQLGEPEGYRRMRIMQIHQISVLICNGINAAYRDTLVASGVGVITKYSGSVDQALDDYLQGRIQAEEYSPVESAPVFVVPHEKLVEQARGLFESNGYRVRPGPGPDAFLIDLVAEIECPICHQPVRVAVCCGAHTYRPNQEISEFHHATRSGYHARAYVCPRQESIWKCCREYGIEALDPVWIATAESRAAKSRIPLLHGPIVNHERASLETS